MSDPAQERLWANGHADTAGQSVDRADQEGDLAKILKLQMHLPFDHHAFSSRNLSHKFAREQNDPHARQFILALFVTSRRHLSTHSDNWLNAHSRTQLRNIMQLSKRIRSHSMF